jgi:hypothetical protein
MTRLGTPFAVMFAVIAVLLLADVGIIAVRLTSGHPVNAPVASQPAPKSPATTQHPCNHGSEVSKAAHQHKGGQYVSGVARSRAGKNGSCA